MAQTAETRMSMYNLYLLSNYNVPKHREEREDRRKCCFAVYDEEGNMVNFQAIREVSNSSAASIGMRNYDHLVTAVYEFLRK